MIEGAGADRWAFCYQAQVDTAGTDIVKQMLSTVAQWAKALGATSLLMATQIDPQVWARSYQFETVRHVLRRAL
jgi:hypothetical protein